MLAEVRVGTLRAVDAVVLVDQQQQVAPARVHEVHRHRQVAAQLVLHADAEGAVRRRVEAALLEAVDGWRRVGDGDAGPAHARIGIAGEEQGGGLDRAAEQHAKQRHVQEHLVVVDAEAAAHRGLALAAGVPGEVQARREVVLVALHGDVVLVVPAQAEVEREPRRHPPLVLDEERVEVVVDVEVRIARALLVDEGVGVGVGGVEGAVGAGR